MCVKSDPVTGPVVSQVVNSGIALLFHDHGTRRLWVVSVTPRPYFTPLEKPSTHCTGGCVGPTAGLDWRKISGIRSPDRPARNQSLYQLSYPTHCLHVKCRNYCQISMKLEYSRQIFRKRLKYQISSKSVQWEPSCSMRTGRTGMAKLIVAFAQFSECA